jgi:DNA invertase Pin-like site-specific DNA recombinase
MTGMLGVYLVAAELSKLGFIVSPTSRSAAGADLLVTDQKCCKAWSVQVKTQMKVANYWTARSVAVEFVKEHLTFTGEDSPMSNLLLSMLGAVAEFERALILERQREGIALAKAEGKYKGRKRTLTTAQVTDLCTKAALGDDSKTALAEEFGISRETLYQYIKAGNAPRTA